MNYELAKKLKDAGFPQKSPNEEVVMEEIDFTEPYKGRGALVGKVYIPILSELIEACGDRFRSLCRVHYDTSDFNSKYVWHSDSFMNETGVGETPEEAVANLWLELNNKKIC